MNLLRINLDTRDFINLNKPDDMYIRINISKYNIDIIHEIYGKIDIFYERIKFTYNTNNKELTLMCKPNSITIDFTSILEGRELKLKQLGI